MSSSFATPWTVAGQAPPSMGFHRQEYWSGLSFPSPGNLPNSGIEPMSPALESRLFTTVLLGKHMVNYTYINNQAKFIKPDAFYKQTSFNLATFGRHEGDFREKKSMFQ